MSDHHRMTGVSSPAEPAARLAVEAAVEWAAGPDGARALVFHSLAQAETILCVAADTGCAVLLISAEGAAAYAGAPWFVGIVRSLAAYAADSRPTWSAWLDCGPWPGLVVEALEVGAQHLVFTGDTAYAAKLDDLARQRAAVLRLTRPASVDPWITPRPLQSIRRALLLGRSAPDGA